MNTFDGTYFKHQTKGHTVAFIAGTAADHAFIQVLTDRESLYFRYPLTAYTPGEAFRVGGSRFSQNGILIDIEENRASIHGALRYSELTPPRSDIMGPFRYLPMQCRHRLVSLHHRIHGSLDMNGETVDFSGGAGYIEGDAGSSFPRRYTWLQCNDFLEKACVTVSVADIPLLGLRFRGCIAAVYADGREYRLATYRGCRPLRWSEDRIVLKQGKLLLEIAVDSGAGHRLMAPERGEMVRTIRETLCCPARFRLTEAGAVLFERASNRVSFEFV